MKKILAVLFLTLSVFALALPAAAQQNALDPAAAPNFGTLNLDAGFQPDPYIVTIMSGGDLDASTLQLRSDCLGFMTSAPDVRLQWNGEVSRLRFFFTSEGDTTMIVSDPSGQFWCNDDGDGLNPVVDVVNPAVGAYNVWVGSYSQEEFVPGYLMLTEGESLPSALLSPLLGGAEQSSTTPQPSTSGGGTIEGLEEYPGLAYDHVTVFVDYPQRPPAGGQHAPVWQNCGVYTEPLLDELAVHSLEHGAVWMTYQPGLPASEVAILEQITLQSDHRLLSPYPGLTSPIMLVAWGYRLPLESASDPRLMQFINQFESGPTTPERGASCSGGESRVASDFK